MAHNNAARPEASRITWLVSYPKSGNTWTRVFLSNYLGDGICDSDINELEVGAHASSRLMFDRAAGIASAWLLPEEIRELRPKVFRQVAATSGRALFLKVHDAWARTSRGEPLFPACVTRAAVYIVRNPLDVAASARHHWGIPAQDAVAQLCQSTFTLAASRNGIPGMQLLQQVGDWSSHVRSWLHDSGLPVHVMRYEDMLADPHSSFGRMLRAAGIAVEPARLEQAVAAASFCKLQQQEARIGFRERRTCASAPFFRQGAAGGWRTELTQELVRQIIDTHADVMMELGYLDDARRPAY